MSKTINEYIEDDKNYFKKMIIEYEALCIINNKKPVQEKSKHVAKHPNGQINIAVYDPKTDVMKQFNCVTKDNPKGTSQMIYKVHTK